MASASRDDLATLRGHFPILQRTNYLISNSLGAVPAQAFESVNAYVETWAERGVRAWEESWWNMGVELGDLVAPLIGAAPGTVVFQPNVTLAHAILFSCFDFSGPRNRVVTDEMHFPSILYLLKGLERLGAEVVVVPSDDGVTVDSSRVADALDHRTAFVNVSHVLFKSAFIHDVAAIVGRARELDCAVIVDGYQAVGTIPVDVGALGVDAYVGGCLKWLCGGPGAAFTWVSPRHHAEWAPWLTGWMSHVEPFAFSADLTRRHDAWRFLTGTPNISALYAARPGLELVAKAGPEAIRAKSMRQTAHLMEAALERGWSTTAPRDPERRGGTVALDIPHGYATSACLKARDILCDYRPGAGIRLSPHFYTLDSEIEAAVTAIGEIQQRELWREYADRQVTVT